MPLIYITIDQAVEIHANTVEVSGGGILPQPSPAHHPVPALPMPSAAQSPTVRQEISFDLPKQGR